MKAINESFETPLFRFPFSPPSPAAGVLLFPSGLDDVLLGLEPWFITEAR